MPKWSHKVLRSQDVWLANPWSLPLLLPCRSLPGLSFTCSVTALPRYSLLIRNDLLRRLKGALGLSLSNVRIRQIVRDPGEVESGGKSKSDHPLLAPEKGHARAPRGARGDTPHQSGALIRILSSECLTLLVHLGTKHLGTNFLPSGRKLGMLNILHSQTAQQPFLATLFENSSKNNTE